MEDIIYEKYNLSGLNAIFTGFLFVLINIRFIGFDILPNFIGYIFVFCGLVRLSEYDPHFEKAKPFAVLAMILSLFDFYQVNYKINDIPTGTINYVIITGLLSLIFRLLLYYYLISGIYIIAHRIQINEICSRGVLVWRMLVIANIFGYLMTIGVCLFTEYMLYLTVVAVIVFLIIQISFLVFLKKSYSLLDGKIIVAEHEPLSGHSVFKKFFARFYCIPIALGLVCIITVGVLYSHNNFIVQTEAYNSQDSSYSQIYVNIIREKMIRAGFTENDIADMPDSEILNYKNIKSTQRKEDSINTDGGECSVISYVSESGDEPGRLRFAVIYHWNEKPNNAFADIIGINTPQNSFVIDYNHAQAASYNLYDKQNEGDAVITYSADDIKYECDGFKNYKY